MGGGRGNVVRGNFSHRQIQKGWSGEVQNYYINKSRREEMKYMLNEDELEWVVEGVDDEDIVYIKVIEASKTFGYWSITLTSIL